MASETLTRGGLPRIQWSPVITGVLCALAAHIVLGLFGAAFGFAAEPADSKGIGVAAGIWGLAVPLVASFIGAWVCVRIAEDAGEAGAYLHGALVWCIGLIAGALFITGTIASSAMTTATATSGNVRGGISRSEATPRNPLTEQRLDQAGKGAAATAGAGGLGALLGLAGAALGAAVGRRTRTGQGFGVRRGGGMHFGHRDERTVTTERTGVVASSTPMPRAGEIPGRAPETRPGDILRPGEDPTVHH